MKRVIVVILKFILAHLKEFRKSGISEKLRREAGVQSVDGARARSYSGVPCGPGWAVPVKDKNGNTLLRVVKPDKPFTFPDGKEAKYLWPRRTRLHLYFPPGARMFLDDATAPLTITEGIKKVLSAVEYGFAAIGLNGVWAWREEGRPIPDFDELVWKGRAVFITFDSDVVEKTQVLQALRHLSFELERRGARVRIVRLPKLANTDKTGLDDFLVAKGPNAYRVLLVEAKSTLDFHMDYLATCAPGERGQAIAKLILDVKKHAPIVREEYVLAVMQRFGHSRRDIFAAVKQIELEMNRSDSHVVDPHFYACGLVSNYFSQEEVGTLRFYKESWWIWEGYCYRRLMPKEFTAVINRTLREYLNGLGQQEVEVNPHLVANVLQALSSFCLVEDGDMPVWLGKSAPPGGRDLLPMKNGLLNLDAALKGETTDALLPQTPAWFSVAAWPFKFLPEARCPMWTRFIRTAMRGHEDLISILQEFLGYCLTFDTSLEKFLVLVGGGANGKTVLTDVFTQVLGPNNVTHIGLELFGDKFALARTIGKLANIASEVGPAKGQIEGIVKAIVSGNPISVEFKNQNAFDAKPTIRLIFATNSIPRFNDKSQGIWRRTMIIGFDHEVPVDEQDPKLAQKICAAELPGIFNWAIEGLRRLKKNGKFTESALVKQAVEQHRTDSDPDRQHLEENYTFDPAAKIKCDDVYRRYRRACIFHSYPISSKAVFGRTIHFMFPKVKRIQCREENGGREYYYIGLRLRR